MDQLQVYQDNSNTNRFMAGKLAGCSTACLDARRLLRYACPGYLNYTLSRHKAKALAG